MNKRLRCILFCFVLILKGFGADKDEIYNEYEYAFIEATRQELIGSLVESARLYHSCLEYDNNDATVLYKLSQIYFSVQNIKEAIYYAKKAYEINSKNDWIVYNIIRLYTKANYLDSAKNICEKEIRLNPERDLIHKGYIEILLLEKKYKRAIKYISKFKKWDRSLLIYKIHCYNQLKDFEKSIDILKEAKEYYPEDTEILGLIAETYAKEGDLRNAETEYQNIFNIEPGNTLYWLSYFDFGNMYKNSTVIKNFGIKIIDDKNITIKNKLYVLKCLDDMGLNNLKDSLLNIIMIDYQNWNNDAYLIKEYLVKSKNYNGAKEYLLRIKGKNINNTGFWQNLLFTIGFDKGDTAIKYCEEAYLRFKNDYLFTWFYGVALKTNNDLEKAKDIIDNVKIRNIDNINLKVEFYILRGEINEKLKNYKEADRNFEYALTIDPDNLMLKNNYSYYLSVRNEKLEYATNLIKDCLKIEPENFIYLDTYGWILYKIEKYKLAKKYIEKALYLNGEDHSEILDHYGDILLKEGKKKDAIYYWKKAIENEKSYEKINLIEEKIMKYQ